MNRKVVAVIWDDHVYVDRDKIPKNPDEVLTNNLSIGILYKETDKVIVLVNCVEAYEERDDASYTVIVKATIQHIKEYGEIKLKKLRE